MTQNIALDFESGANTVAFTTGTSGFSSLSGTTPTGTTTAHQGSIACQFATTTATSIGRFDLVSTGTEWISFYFRTAAAWVQVPIARWFQGTVIVGDLRLDTAGTLTLRDNATGVFTSTTVLAANTWYRLSVKVIPGSSTGHQLKIYAGANLDGATATEDSGGKACTASAATAVDNVRWGVLSSSTNTVIVDRIRGDNATEPAGLTAATGTFPVKVWNGSAWVVKPVKVWNGSAWVVKVVRNQTSAPPTTAAVLFGSSYQSNSTSGWTTMDADLATQAGLTGRVMLIRRNYNSNIPSSFGGSAASANPGLNIHSCLSTKSGTDTDMQNGINDAAVISLVQSCPSAYKTYLVWNHEPEQMVPAVFRAGFARFAKLVVANRGSLPVTPTWIIQSSTGRQEAGRVYSDWDPVVELGANSVAAGHPTLGPLALSNVVMGQDGYSLKAGTTTAASRFDPGWGLATTNGYTRFLVGETACDSSGQFNTVAEARTWTSAAVTYFAGLTGCEAVMWFSSGVGANAPTAGWFMFDNTQKTTWADAARGLGF